MATTVNTRAEDESGKKFLAPRYWLTWAGFGFLWLLHLLHYRLQQPVGHMLGQVFRLANPYRRKIVSINLSLCFPEHDERQRRRLARRFFSSLGISMVEESDSIWSAGGHFNKWGQVEGLEHVRAAQAQGKGVLLLSGHFCSVDFAGRVLVQHMPVCFTYQELRNPLSDHILTRARDKFAHRMIHRHNIRGFVKALKDGEIVWYAPDQSLQRKNSVFAPFFGIPANTLTATTKLVKMTGAAVLPLAIKRLPGARGYALTIQPPLEDFPGESETADATRFNALLETQVRANPEQYLWTHRRFKKRPEGETRLYPPKPRRVRRMRRAEKKRAAR